jgi:hypothetical protein
MFKALFYFHNNFQTSDAEKERVLPRSKRSNMTNPAR